MVAIHCSEQNWRHEQDAPLHPIGYPTTDTDSEPSALDLTVTKCRAAGSVVPFVGSPNCSLQFA